MMLLGPFLVALIPWIIILTFSWWLSKKGFTLFVRMLPGIIAIIVAVILFYIGIVNIRGFEGGAYAILGFFLTIFSIISFATVAQKKNNQRYNI
ncbi:YesK-like protein [Gracilibacillus orientalis]|uniref:YesK-like protein n=1 Tax=Gracilibacillus orientalis TaxID=334253 RepID=A0A1I4M6C7_9BACI|nr:YesK family protein [Gracilibacillus orientalis]SFL98653.1 YesK-like protein [Gracilibacillus orientalis]